MENLVIENIGNQLILKLNKKVFDKNFLISIVKKMELENLAIKSEFNQELMNIAEQINRDWWEANGDKFLEGVKK